MMTLEEKNQILYNALAQACALMRQNPPMSMDWFLEEPTRMQILSGGATRDPQGQEWMVYFINEAKKALGKEE